MRKVYLSTTAIAPLDKGNDQMTIKAEIKQNGKVTHEREGFANPHDARRWASVQGHEGFDFTPIGNSGISFVDYDRNAILSLSK